LPAEHFDAAPVPPPDIYHLLKFVWMIVRQVLVERSCCMRLRWCTATRFNNTAQFAYCFAVVFSNLKKIQTEDRFFILHSTLYTPIYKMPIKLKWTKEWCATVYKHAKSMNQWLSDHQLYFSN